MSEHRTVKRVTPTDIQVAKNDPYLSLIHRAQSKSDVIAMVDQMGIADPKHHAAMVGLSVLAWIVLRRM
jgi:hypothetical protein